MKTTVGTIIGTISFSILWELYYHLFIMATILSSFYYGNYVIIFYCHLLNVFQNLYKILTIIVYVCNLKLRYNRWFSYQYYFWLLLTLVKEFSEGWKGFTAIIFYKDDIVRAFLLEDYESNKRVSKSLIHGGFIDRFREVKCA